jgi:hypothetical protein
VEIKFEQGHVASQQVSVLLIFQGHRTFSARCNGFGDMNMKKSLSGKRISVGVKIA